MNRLLHTCARTLPAWRRSIHLGNWNGSCSASVINVAQLAFDFVAAENTFARQLLQGEGSGGNLFAPVFFLALGCKELHNLQRCEYGQGTGMFLEVAGDGFLIPASKVSGAGCLRE